MEFRILGPLEVLEDGKQVDVGGAKQRALLACLLVHANDVVSTDRLIDALWEDEAPETAQKALQVYISQLRKALGKERLETKAPGYRLRVEPGELDRERFEQLLAEGKPREALEAYQEARRELVEELGIGPSAELRELQQAILRQDAALDLPVQADLSPEALEPPRGAFVGRENELEQLYTGFADAVAGRGSLF